MLAKPVPALAVLQPTANLRFRLCLFLGGPRFKDWSAMFIRFVVPSLDFDSHCATGVFQAAHELRREKALSSYEDEWLKDISRWFDERLPIPERLSRSSRAHAHSNGVSWFKATAREHIA